MIRSVVRLIESKTRDKVDPESATYSNTSQPYPMSKALPKYLPPLSSNLVEIKFPEGGVIEDMRGVPLFMKICGLPSQDIQDKVAMAGVGFSQTYKFEETDHRHQWADIPDSPYLPGKAHYAFWNEMGHMHKHPCAAKELSNWKNHENWCRLLQVSEPIFHYINMIIDTLDPKLAQLMSQLRKQITQDKIHLGFLVGKGVSYFPSIGIHFNSQPVRPGEPVDRKAHRMGVRDIPISPMVPPSRDGHTDRRSLFHAWDVISSYGWYENVKLELPELGICVVMKPGDIILIRGAALCHRVNAEWTGTGRFVIVPFCDRRLFAWMRVERPDSMRQLYGINHRRFRSNHRAIPLLEVLEGKVLL
ncbi:hypothetical protein DL93DRAFT_786186 [Clavulina sp. PMI_390]|nr:hypothetical protein DL93DRAFT_786186 [Clavulina sp. PMI_390]